jgi:hypothetical protein
VKTLKEIVELLDIHDRYAAVRARYYQLKAQDKTYTGIKKQRLAAEHLLAAQALKAEIWATNDESDAALESANRKSHAYHAHVVKANKLILEAMRDNPKSYWLDETVAFVSGTLDFKVEDVFRMARDEARNEQRIRSD